MGLQRVRHDWMTEHALTCIMYYKDYGCRQVPRYLQNESANWRPRRTNGVIPVGMSAGLRSRKSQCLSSGLKARGKKQYPISKTFREEDSSYPWQGYPFCSIQSFNWLDEDHPHWGKRSAWLSLLIQMLLSSRNTFTEILRIMFKQISGEPMA